MESKLKIVVLSESFEVYGCIFLVREYPLNRINTTMSDWDEEGTNIPSVGYETNAWENNWRQVEKPRWPAKSGNFRQSDNSSRGRGRGRANRFGSWNSNQGSESSDSFRTSNENGFSRRGFGRASNVDSAQTQALGSRGGFGREGRANGRWSDNVNDTERSGFNRGGESSGNRSSSTVTVDSGDVGRIIGESCETTLVGPLRKLKACRQEILLLISDNFGLIKSRKDE